MCYLKTTFNNVKTTLSKIHPNIYYIGLVGFFMNFAATMIYTTVIFVVGGKNNIISESSFVAVRNISEGLGNLSKIFSGYISDKIQNRKTFLLIGYGGMLLTKFGFTFLTFKDMLPFSLLFLQVLYIVNQNIDRVLNSIRDPARDAILMECSQPETRGVSYGLRKFITSLGSILSGIFTTCLVYHWHNGVPNNLIFKYGLFPCLAIMTMIVGYLTKKFVLVILITLSLVTLGAAANHITFPSLLYMNSLLPVMLVILVIKYLVKEPKRTSGGKKHLVNFKLLKVNFKHMKKAWLLLGIICLLSLGKLNDSFLFLLGINYFGMSKYTIPLMFTVMYVCVTLTSILFGWMIDKKKSFLVLLLTVSCLLFGQFILYYTTSIYFFWVGLLLISTFLAASDSAVASIISFLIPDPNIKATVYGLVYGISGFVTILNALVIMIFNNYLTLKQMYGISTLPIIISLIILLCSYKAFDQAIVIPQDSTMKKNAI